MDTVPAGRFAFIAFTWKVYEVPLLRPVTVQLAVVPAVMCALSVQVRAPGVEVTIWPVTAEPPLFGTLHVTVARPVAAFARPSTLAAVIEVGVPGSPGRFDAEAVDATLAP